MRLRTAARVFVCVTAAVCALAGQSLAGEWVGVRTQNFTVAGDAAETDIRRVAARLEQFRRVVEFHFPRTDFRPPNQIRVLVFRDAKSFPSFKSRESSGGYFKAGEDAGYIVVSADDANFRDLFHEYAHFLIDNAIGRTNLPPWIYEGLAEYFEQFTVDAGGKASVGGFGAGHAAAFEHDKLIPFNVFTELDYYSLHRQKKENARLFYAQALSLIYYLAQGEKDFSKFEDFARTTRAGSSVREALRQVFGKDLSALEAGLKEFIEHGRYPAVFADPHGASVYRGPVETMRLSEADAKALRGDLLYRLNRPAEAGMLLREALVLDPRSVPANISLGFVKTMERKFDEAKTLLERAVSEDPENFLAHYGLAFVLSREEMTGYGFVSGYNASLAEKIRESLKRAIRLNPDFAESYQLYAFVSFVRNEQVNEALSLIDKGLEIAPGNQWYLLRRAQLLMRKEDFTGARMIAQRVIPTASEDGLKVYAENTLTVIDSLEAQLLNIKYRRYKNVDNLITDEPVSEEELRRRREKAIIESVNKALRIPDFNEKRVLAFVTKIECQPQQVIIVAKLENEVIQFRIDSLNNLMLIAFEGELANSEFGCGVMKREGFSVITYRPAADTASRIAGEIVSIEFVPRNFRFLEAAK